MRSKFLKNSKILVIFIFVFSLLGCISEKHVYTEPLTASENKNQRKESIKEYEQALIDTIKNNWYMQQLGALNVPLKGDEIILEVHLHRNGQITDVSTIKDSEGHGQMKLCRKAVSRTSPFRSWPDEARHKLAGDYQVLRFTFHFLPLKDEKGKSLIAK